MTRAQLSHILDVVSGETGNIYQTIGTKKEAAPVNPDHTGGKQVASVVEEHTQRQMVYISSWGISTTWRTTWSRSAS